MGIIAWIALGMAVGLLANTLLPGKDHGRLFFIRLARRPRRSSGHGAGLPPAKGSHHSSFGIMIGPPARAVQ
jgi:hypothetical protein